MELHLHSWPLRSAIHVRNQPLSDACTRMAHTAHSTHKAGAKLGRDRARAHGRIIDSSACPSVLLPGGASTWSCRVLAIQTPGCDVSCTAGKFVASTVIGATSVEQLAQNLGGFQVEWTDEMEADVLAVYEAIPDPWRIQRAGMG